MKKNDYKKSLNSNKNRVFSYAYYFLHNREDAEDVTQEVFIRLWKYWDTITREKRKAWIMRVTHNCCIDQLRKKQTSVTDSKNIKQMELDTLVSFDEKKMNPEMIYELNEEQNQIVSALKTMPENTRSILLMHYFQGFKYETIGEILNMNLNTVKVTVHRGKKILREKLEKEFPERIEKKSNEYIVS